jgi:IS30 family transposase
MSLHRARFAHFTIAEREIIRRMRTQKSSFVAIARLLNKSRISVWREVKGNTNEVGIYYEKHAHARMLRRRRNAKEKSLIIDNDLQMQAHIEKLLISHLSPEQIAGYMARSGYLRPVCHKTIYRWVHRKWKSRKAYLRFKGRPRVPCGFKKTMWQPHKRHISTRPLLVDKRRRVGDWEADLVHGTQDDSRHCLLTLNDRASGFCIIRKVATRHSFPIAHIIVLALNGLPVRTITCDNGTEFGYHKLIERKLKCQVYFADPNHPEQRGSNENLNGLVREFFPKGKSLAHVTQADALLAATLLNRRPRKRFGYECPRNVFAAMSGLSAYIIR